MKATAKAHTNIALIKYWGKRNEALILPMNNSLSLTLDAFFTTTTVAFDANLSTDKFILNDSPVKGEAYARVKGFLDLVRSYVDDPIPFAEVHSTNNVPTAAGFASSASGFAALAAAASGALGLKLDNDALSRLTRRGSGSACRSVYGGFVEWEMGKETDGSDSFAVQVQPANHWDIRVAAVILSKIEKKVSSRAGMRSTVDTSPFYTGWVESIPADLAAIKEGIAARDFEKVGQIAEANCMKMHATTFGANPPFTYWRDTTFSVMQEIQNMRERGIPVYFTIDAGPNVKVLYLPEYETVVQETLSQIHGVEDVIVSRVGQGITYL